MKASSKRDSTVPGAPEEMYAPETQWAYASPRGPAPAGALQRHYEDGYAPAEEENADQPEYVPVRGRLRLRNVLRTTTGRIVVASTAFVALAVAATTAFVAYSYV